MDKRKRKINMKAFLIHLAAIIIYALCVWFIVYDIKLTAGDRFFILFMHLPFQFAAVGICDTNGFYKSKQK